MGDFPEFTTRPELAGTFGMVASTHWLASAAGMAVLEQGGNAFDAAVAAGLVLQVTEPHLNGPGGEVPIIAHDAARGETFVLCGQGTAPAAATPEVFADLGLDLVPGSGLLAACVPGAFGAWMLLLREFGTLRLRDVLGYAIGYAAGGYPLVPAISGGIASVAGLFRDHWPSSAEVYLPGGAVPRAGSRFANPALAATYQRILAEAEAASGDRDEQIEAARRAFYEGFVAEAIAAYLAEAEVMDVTGLPHRGLLSRADLADWRPRLEEPLTFEAYGLTVCKTGPWGQGPVFGQQVALLGGFDLAAMGPHSADYIHTVIECAKLAFADREAWYGDPDFTDVPVKALLSPGYAEARRALVGPQASPDLVPGAPDGRPPRLPEFITRSHRSSEITGSGDPSAGLPLDPGTGEPTPRTAGPGDTCHLDVADRFGNLVSATPSGGWLQSSPVIPGLGFCLGTRAQMFTLTPGLPATLAPRKRPRTTLTPSLALRDGEPYLAFGTPGGDQQDQWSLLFFLNHALTGMNLQQAIDFPAFHSAHMPSSFYPRQAQPRVVDIESRADPAVIGELRRRGHLVNVRPAWSLGRVSAVARRDGLLYAAANARGMQGYAVGRLPECLIPTGRGCRRSAENCLGAGLALDHKMNGVTSAGYLRYPHVHGELLVFVAEDDVWLAPAEGGRAWRLSADAAPVGSPRFSPDGSRIAWTSWRDGNPEVYTADPDGGDAARLTYWGDDRVSVAGWTSAGEVLAVSAAGQPEIQYSWAYSIPLEGTPRRLPFGPVFDFTLTDTGVALLTGRFGDPAYWKRYRGGTSGKMWVAGNGQGPFTRVLADLPGQLASPMLIGDRLFFLSDHEGTGNIYSCALDGTDVRRHTDHDGMYARNPATDGQRIVYHVAGDLWILDRADHPEPRRLEITLGSPAAARAPRLVSARDHLGSLDCDQTGQASAVEVRGTVHWLTHKDGPARALYVNPQARARLPRVLGDSGRVVWVTDAGGSDALEITAADGDTPLVRLAEGLLGSVLSLAASPDGATVAAAAHDGRLLVVELATASVTELAAGDDGALDGLCFSPDSAWLAWSQPGPQPLRRIRVARLADGEVIDVTDGRFADTDPAFTADGLYLAFVSRRSFDPVYDAQSFDLSFPYGSRPYLVALAAETPSPFGPLPAGRPVSQDPPAGEKTNSAERAVVTVHADGLTDRVVGVPVPEARYSGLQAVKGGLAWLREPVAGVLGEGGAELDGDPARPALERFDLRKREVTELAGELDWFAVSGDGTRLVIKDGGDLRVVPSERKDNHGSGDTVTVDASRARFMADPAALWRHAYGEAGRLMRRDYWVPDMSGVDWDGVLDAYRPLLDRIRGADDFTDLLWEVLGELGTSHAYAFKPGSDPFGPSSGPPAPAAVGQLGADVSRDDSGRWIVDRVLPGESSDPRARSPLLAPGVAVRAGDELVAVDGQPVDPVRGPWPLLAGAVGKPAELTVRAPGSAAVRRVVVVPLRDERRLRYQDWVAGNRRAVRELGAGRLGYLHIPDMVGHGWAHFSRDLRTEMRFDALIMDVRGNSGGHISQLVVEKLARQVIGWDVGRWLRPVSYPDEARRGPLVTLADENAGSDGDIVTAAIRSLGLGPVVGTRTWGGVIGFTELHGLVDGTQLSVPQLAFSFTDFGWGVENYGVDPDVEVLFTPDDWAAGRDPQLETAVRLALEALEKQPPSAPPDPPTGSSKARPPLPPRAPRPAGGA